MEWQRSHHRFRTVAFDCVVATVEDVDLERPLRVLAQRVDQDLALEETLLPGSDEDLYLLLRHRVLVSFVRQRLLQGHAIKHLELASARRVPNLSPTAFIKLARAFHG